MDNHVHLIVMPQRSDSLAKTIKEAHSEYSRYLNTKYGLVGHAWQGRFKSVPMEREHYINAVRYVLQNPVRAGMVDRAEQYKWSSAAARSGLRDDPLIVDHELVGLIKDWPEWLSNSDEKANDLIRRHTRTGRPLGSKQFLKRLEIQTGRKLLPQKRGPRSASEQSEKGEDQTNEVDTTRETPSLFG
jgi:putative transposase